jgi:acetylornithine deacetylase/succinyl-diaminopimelate desuccinylase-like protein
MAGPATLPDVPALAGRGVVARALRVLADTDAQTLDDMCAVAEIPAPSGAEAKRAAWTARRFTDVGLTGIETDEVGNVIGLLPGTDPSRPTVIVAAHLDTVFPASADHRVQSVGGRLYAPGIADNARGIAAMIALARALVHTRIGTIDSLAFIATVGEEGAGDLRGVKHLFRAGSSWRRTAAFIALDGSGSRRIVHRGVGSRRLRIELRGPGGHSWADRGTANPVHAIGAAITEIVALPASGTGALTIARIAGGETINAVPAAAWLEVDIRNENAADLSATERRVRTAAERSTTRENEARRIGTAPLTLSVEVIGDRPTGETSTTAPLVRTALAVTRHIGETPELIASSTDANVPMALGIPAIALGAGGEAAGTHTLSEWYTNDGGPAGLQRVALIVLGVAGLDKSG